MAEDFNKMEIKDFDDGVEDPDIIEKKLAICRACENFSPEDSMCKLCDCSLIPKIRVKDSKCIIHKWIFIELPND